MSTQKVMRWRGQEVKTVGNLVDALANIVQRNNPDEARHFLTLYREALGKNVADKNVGYCLGYLSQDKMVRGLRLFGVSHPFFGSAEDAKTVTAAKAFKQGIKLGQEIQAADALSRKVVPEKEK